MKGNVLSSLYGYYTLNFGYLMEFSFKHLLMSTYGVLFACITGIPIGILAVRYPKIAWPVIAIADIIQTVPVIIMLAVLMLALGPGPSIAVLAVSLYALLPIVRSTCTDITEADHSIRDAGKGMGMTNNQVMRAIEPPLSLSVVIGGIRIAFIVTIGIVATGSFIGAPTLGNITTRGTNSTDSTVFIFAGVIPAALITILIDIGLRLLEKKLNSTHRSSKQVQSLR